MSAEEEIRAAIETFNAAYRRGDLAALLSVYSEELIKDRAGAPSEGKSQTAARIREVFAGYETDLAVRIAEVWVSGDLACVRGSFTVTLRPRSGGKAVSFARRYLEIWRNESGVWRVIRTMDNEDAS